MEIKIILLIYTIITLINYLRRPKYNILCCGLWCYVGDEPADPQKLKILALYNLSRGDHATGICINNTIVKDTENAKDFLKEHGKLLDITPELTNYTILGHCRQATAAYDKTNKDFAHPHKIVGDQGALLYLVHNGTITNVDDLCSKYKIDANFQKFSDSIQIARIIAKTWDSQDKEILRDYEGSATLVFYPHGVVNTLYVHRDQARELFYWKQEHGVYISSIKDSLLVIGADEEDVHEFKHGILTEFTGAEITNSWDYSEKKPYTKPRVYSTVLPKAVKTDKSKNGFYWENHLIFFNGHAYTGDFYLKGRSAVQFVSDPTYTKIFCFQGVVIKDERAFDELKAKCVNPKTKLNDPKIFKKMTPLQISKYALYPVAGGFGNASSNQAFWTPELFALQAEPEKSYKWSPPLSNQTFEINSNGTLRCSIYGSGTFLSVREFIQDKIDEKIRTHTFYETIGQMFSEFKDSNKINVKAETVDAFYDAVFEVMRETGVLTTVEESEIQRVKNQDFMYKGYFEQETYGEILCRYLKRVCKAGIELREDQEEIIEPVEDFYNDTNWFKSTHFRDQVLFGNFESFDDLVTNHVESDDPKYVRPLYQGVAEVFKNIGWIANEDVENIKIKSLNDVKFTLSRFYDNLKSESFFIDLLESYSGSDKDIYATISNMYWDIEALVQKEHKTDKDETHLSVYKLCLNYILNNHRTLNETKLVEDYKITRKELETVCQ